tara:strand:- start:113 stop:397 length:285 start_codon:yes stop_codon:yes gene_type:complete
LRSGFNSSEIYFIEVERENAYAAPHRSALIKGVGRERALKYVASVNTGNGMNVFDLLELALKDRKADTIYLLSDGMLHDGKILDLEPFVDGFVS